MSECCEGKKKCCSNSTKKREEVQEYYGKVLQGSSDLKTNVCTQPSNAVKGVLKEYLPLIHPEVLERYYGCGVPIPQGIRGATILDLGSGSGRDCYILSKIVGQEGRVIGLDMTEEQVALAKKHVDYHTKKFGYETPNVKFVQGFIEDLADSGVESESIDVIVSNCVVNLSPNKKAVLSEAYRTLEIGGEFYFSDVFTNEPLSQAVKDNKVLWGECISGALVWKEFVALATEVGFSEPHLITAHTITINNDELKALVGDALFVSASIRLLKLPKCGRPPGPVTYRGTIEGYPKELPFNHGITFKVGEPLIVDVGVRTFLSASRYKKHFNIPEATPGQTPIHVDMDPFKYCSANPTTTKSCCK